MSVTMSCYAGLLRFSFLACKSNSSFSSRALFHSRSVTLAGQNLRIQQGLGRSGNEYGPLHDEPDFLYAGKEYFNLFPMFRLC